MQTETHKAHLANNMSHNSCCECRADCERQFVRLSPWAKYQYVSEYLAYVRPRLQACVVDNSVDARVWYRGFVKALHVRITLRTTVAGRKQSDGYLQRLGQFSRNRQDNHFADAGYLRSYASRGASCLDS